jgi:hypothetical protein
MGLHVDSDPGGLQGSGQLSYLDLGACGQQEESGNKKKSEGTISHINTSGTASAYTAHAVVFHE